MNRNTYKLVVMAMLTALGYVFILFIRTPIFPTAPYLVYDAGDVPIILGTLMFGPLEGLAMTAVLSFLQMLFLSTDGFIGFIMHVAATGMLVMVSGLLYKKHKTKKHAIIGLILGSIGMTLIMLPINYLVQVFYYGQPENFIIPLLPTIAAFNAIKAFGNSLIVILIYKPLSRFIKGKMAK